MQVDQMPLERTRHGAGPPIGERRACSRTHTVFFMVKITRAYDSGLFRVKNISDTGLMLATHVTFSCREPVTIELLPSLVVHGVVAWCEEGSCGVELDQPINCAAVLCRRTQLRLDRRGNSLRLPVSRLATCYGENGIRAVKVTDVSRRGVGLVQDGSLHEGMAVKLVLESGTERSGMVRWSKDGHAGVRLAEPLTWGELESAKHL